LGTLVTISPLRFSSSTRPSEKSFVCRRECLSHWQLTPPDNFYRPSGDTKCITQDLTNVQDYIGGDLSLTNIVSFVASGNVALPSNVTCTDCTKAAYNLLSEQQASLVGTASSEVESQCGASFTGVSIAVILTRL
jgi:hypothetical protein